MADERTEAKPQNINDALFDSGVRHLIGLERLENGLTKQFVATLNETDREFLAEVRLHLADVTDPDLTGAQLTRRLNEMRSSLRAINNKAYLKLLDNINPEILALIKYEAEFTTNSYTTAFKSFGAVPPELEQLSDTTTKAILAHHLIRGNTVEAWAIGMRDGRLNTIMNTVKNGVIDDETFNAIYQQVNGTRANNFTDGDMGKARRSVETFSRTAVTGLTSGSRDALILQNSEDFEGVQWVSVLDGRTTAICQNRSGKIFPIDKGPRPPAHFRCRSVTVPVSNASPPATDITYSEWLAKQPKSILVDALGKTRAELFRKGDLPHADLFKRNDEFILLKDLKKSESQAFDKAGIE